MGKAQALPLMSLFPCRVAAGSGPEKKGVQWSRGSGSGVHRQVCGRRRFPRRVRAVKGAELAGDEVHPESKRSGHA